MVNPTLFRSNPRAGGVHTWKEIGQGYEDSQQILGTREAQDANYGPVAPGLWAGDILAFTGRFRNTSALAVNTVFSGNFDGELAYNFPEVALNAGDESFYFTPSYTVTPADVARGVASIRCVLEAGGRRLLQEFEADTVTGDVRRMAAYRA